MTVGPPDEPRYSAAASRPLESLIFKKGRKKDFEFVAPAPQTVMSSKPDRQKRPENARNQNDADRGYGWNAIEELESWDGEDRHYVPGPRGPEADDFERRTHPTDDSDEDNVRYFVSCFMLQFQIKLLLDILYPIF